MVTIVLKRFRVGELGKNCGEDRGEDLGGGCWALGTLSILLMPGIFLGAVFMWMWRVKTRWVGDLKVRKVLCALLCGECSRGAMKDVVACTVILGASSYVFAGISNCPRGIHARGEMGIWKCCERRAST